MSAKELMSKQISVSSLIITLIPILTAISGYAISYNISTNERIKTLEIEQVNTERRLTALEEVAKTINCNLVEIKLSLNTISVKYQEKDKLQQ